MIKQIYDCQKCGLCINQKPLLDTEKASSFLALCDDLLWVTV